MIPNRSSASHSVPGGQAGMVLLICLIFLTALTLLGLSASADTVLQNQLTANLQETQRAKQSALAALSWAEHWLLELDSTAPKNCAEACDGLKMHSLGGLPPQPEFKDLSWWIDHGHEAGIDPITGDRKATVSAGSINPPVWIIEAIHAIQPSENPATDLQLWYRILVRGSGWTNAAVSVVESIVVRSWPSSDSVELPGTEASGACPDSGPTKKCGRVSWRELR